MTAPPSSSNARYTIPDWFLECNVKTAADLSAAPDQILICNCDDCKEAKEDDGISDADLANEECSNEAGPDVEKDGAGGANGGWSSLLARELCTDEIHYRTFAKLRDMTAAALVADRDGNLLRPEASAVVLRMEREELTTVTDYDENYDSYERTETTMASCMEPVWMGRAVERVAKALGVALVALDMEDLEELGCEFHRQDKEAQKCKNSDDAAVPSASTLEEPEGSAENKQDGSMENATSTEGREEADDETQEAKEAQEAEDVHEAEDAQEAGHSQGTEDVEDNNETDSSNQQQWDPDVCSLSAFLDHFFAARAERYAATETWERTQLVWTFILDAIKEKLATESTTSEIPDGISRKSAVIVHITDYRDVDFILKKRVLTRFAGMVRQRRKQGDAVVMIVSTKDSSMEPGGRLHGKIGATKASTMVGYNAKKMSDADLAVREQTYSGALNARALRHCLRECCTHLFPMDLLKANADWACAGRGKSFKAFGGTMWTPDDMGHIVTQIMGRAWLKPELKFADIRAVLKRLGFYNAIEPETQGGLASSEKAELENNNDESNTSGNTSEDTTGDTTPQDTADDTTPEDTAEDTTPEDIAPEEEDGDVLSGLDLNYFEQELTKCIVAPGSLKTGWDDVIIDQETKELMQQFVASHSLQFDCASESLRQALRIRGALLYGPPGTGKTQLSRAVATASGSRMLAVSYASLISKDIGEAERYIEAAFTLAGKLHPCVLFMDEVDSLFYRRASSDKSWERSQINEFLHQMDGLSQNDKAPLVLVATNRPWDLDEAFLRRLEHKVYLGLPDTEARARILRLFLHQDDLDPTVNVDGLAQVTEKYSGSDLKSLCAKAGLLWEAEQASLHSLYESVSEKFSMANKRPKKVQLGIDHFVKALDRIQPSNSGNLAEELDKFSRKHNPTALTSAKDPGTRLIYNSSTKRYDRFDVRALISKPTVSDDVTAPKQEYPEDEMQLQTWSQLDLHTHLVQCLHARVAIFLFYCHRVLEQKMQVQAWRQIDLRGHLMRRLYTNLTVLLFCLHCHDPSFATLQQTALDQENSIAAGHDRKVRKRSHRAARRNKSKLKKSASDALDSEDSMTTGPNLKVRQKTQKTARRSKSKVKENVSVALDSEGSTAVGSDSTVREMTQKTPPRDNAKLEEIASATKTATFCYTSLGKDEFRILEIAPGDTDAPLVCILKHTTFQSNEWYCALSYTWGSPEPPYFIKCNGTDIRITKSLHEALCQMRRTWRHVSIWADAICINQNDNSEKSQQVMRMGEIYSKASRLFIWLGNPVTASDADVAVKFVEKLGRVVALMRLKTNVAEAMLEKATFELVWQEMMRGESISEHEWQSLQEFLLMPWFTRVWIFQEAASVMAVSPTNIRVGYGNRVVGWTAVVNVMAIPEPFKTVNPTSVRYHTTVTMEREFSVVSMWRMVNFHLPSYDITDEVVAGALARQPPPDGRPVGAHHELTGLYAGVTIVIDLCRLNIPSTAMPESPQPKPDSDRDSAYMVEAVLTIFSNEFRAIARKFAKQIEDVSLDGLAESALGWYIQQSGAGDEWWLPGNPALLNVRRYAGFTVAASMKNHRGGSVIAIGLKTATFSYMPGILHRLWPRMELARRLEATDPRDKLYAFLGMFSEDVADEPLLQVDYNLHVADVYTNLTIYFLQRLMCLDVLEFVNDMPTERPRLENLPSWAIDLSSPTDLDLFDFGLQFNAGGAFDLGVARFPMHVLQVKVSDDRRRLDLNAYLVGEVTELGFLPHHYKQNDHLTDSADRDDYENIQAAPSRTYGLALDMITMLGQSTGRLRDANIENPELNNCATSTTFDMPSRLYVTGESMSEAFWRCLVCDRLTYQPRDGRQAPISQGGRRTRTGQVYRDYGTMLAKGSIPVDLPSGGEDTRATSKRFGSSNSQPPTPRHDAPLFSNVFEPHARTRVFGVVAGELIGWFPRRARKGDMIVILPGARCPYVLRKVRRDSVMDRNQEDDAAQEQDQQSEWSWEVIGHAYVQGLMRDIVTEWRVDLTDNARELLGKLNPSGEAPVAQRICLV